MYICTCLCCIRGQGFNFKQVCHVNSEDGSCHNPSTRKTKLPKAGSKRDICRKWRSAFNFHRCGDLFLEEKTLSIEFACF